MASTQKKNLTLMQDHIRSLNRDYTWPKFDGKATLIRCTETCSREQADFHVDVWKALAVQGVEVRTIDGIHEELFEEPYVIGLSEVVSDLLKRATVNDTGQSPESDAP